MVPMKTALLNFAKSFLSNLRTTIFALVLAVVIWFAVSFQLFPNVPQTIEVPIDARLSDYMLDSNLELAEEFHETAEVSIEGKRYDIAGLSPDDFLVYLDFSQVREAEEYEIPVAIESKGEKNFNIISKNITKPVQIIQTAEKTLWIKSDVREVEVLDGLNIDYANITLNLQTVTIWGEKSLIDMVHSAQVVAVSQETVSVTTELTGILVLLDKEDNKISDEGIHVEDRAFYVNIPIFKHETLPLKVNIDAPNNFNIKSLEDKMKITPENITIAEKLTGDLPNPTINKETGWELGSILLRDITLGNLKDGLDIQIRLFNTDRYTNMTGIESAVLNFSDMAEYSETQFYVPVSKFKPVNIPVGYEVLRTITQEIPVKVVGPTEVLQSMTAGDINGTIDLRGMTDISAGVRLVGVEFTVAGTNVLSWVVDTYSVEVEIAETR
jgi:hypothetical protein